MSKFGRDIKKWADAAGLGVGEVISSSIIDVSTRIIRATPVGNPTLWKNKPPKGYVGGAARGNWVVGINFKSDAVFPNLVDKSGKVSIDRVVAVAEDAVGEVFWLSNNLPYIGRLEYEGWSQQAPAGMIRINVNAFNQALQEAIAKIK